MSFEIRPVQPADREGVRRVIAGAFGGDGKRVVELVAALDAAGHTRVSLVAEVQGVVSGHVQLSTSWVDARERLVEVLVLSPLSVIPGQQRRGMGGALVSAAIASAAQLGAPAVFLEGSPDYYGPRGFAPGAEHGFVRPSTRIPGRAFQVRLLDHHESWMTGALVYCDPFWKLDCVGLRDPLLAQLEEVRGLPDRLSFEQEFDYGETMSHHVAPPGWPSQVRPPDAPRWEDTAASWLLDICPPDYRAYPGLRRHVVVLARFAVLHVEASQAACHRGLSQARVELREVATPEVVEAAVRTFQLEEARLLGVRRAAGLVEEALRGRRFVARL